MLCCVNKMFIKKYGFYNIWIEFGTVVKYATELREYIVRFFQNQNCTQDRQKVR